MNRQEAQFILEAYRPGGEDATDPRFREALDLVQRDPELARWFAREQALDARLSSRLHALLQPPPSLKTQLLAQRKVVRPAFGWQLWRRPLWQLAAACVGLLLALSVFRGRPTGSGDFPGYLAQMTDRVGHRLDRLDFMARDVSAVRRWLAERGAHGDLVVPAGLNGRPSLGCRLLEWNGQQVTLICFELEGRKTAHLLVVDSSAFPQPPAAAPEFRQVGDVATVSWTQGGKTYVLASKGTAPTDLMKLL